MSSKKHNSTRLLAGVVGNVLEWYDFALYGYLVPVISKLFFPSDNTITSLLATFGIFAIGFLMRPLGAVLFGHIGDRFGRRQALYLSIMLMAAPTFLLGCLPTYASIGVMAAVLLTLLRLVQGLSVGGEFTTSVTYVVETSPTERRGLSGSWANIGSIGGSLLGVGVAATLTTVLPQSSVEAWGWRIPFLLGGVLGIFALWLRRNLPESALFDQQSAEQNDEHSDKSPLRAVFTHNRKELIQAILFTSGFCGATSISAFVSTNRQESST
ncbi:MAG: MFS transporter [Gammaproteobacteria bacterium]|nr:MFS transporter [Gammaproteobacteria bacterium]